MADVAAMSPRERTVSAKEKTATVNVLATMLGPSKTKEHDAATAALCRVRDVFAKQPIFYDQGKDPRVFFTLTDFMAPISHTIIEDIASSMLDVLPFSQCDVIVSVADRSSGAIAHEVSLATELPYTLANWYPRGMPGEVEVAPCSGFSGSGTIWLNGLKRGKRCVIVMDCLRGGSTASNLLAACYRAGCSVVACVFAAELLEYRGRQNPGLSGTKVFSLVPIHVRGERTKEARDAGGVILPPTTPVVPAAAKKPGEGGDTAEEEEAALAALLAGGAPVSALRRADPRNAIIQRLKRMSPEEVREKTLAVQHGFVGVPIITDPNLSYPYSFFQLTDFNPLMTPEVVEMMADLCVAKGNFARCDVIVSEADRGGAPLAQAVARRTGRPYVLANWYPFGAGIGADTKVSVGFSGDGLIVVNGVRKGDRCIFVDDMLSSGGTAEGVLHSVEKLGGIPIEGVFVSEKLYPAKKKTGLPLRKGKDRLKATWPHLDVTTLVQFVAEGARTFAPHEQIG